jgi:hypothetical protein
MLTCDQTSESFNVGKLIAPDGAMAALRAVQAGVLGDHQGVSRYAADALAADRFAIAERDAGRVARRSNVVGNAWSGWFEQITGKPSGW